MDDALVEEMQSQLGKHPFVVLPTSPMRVAWDGALLVLLAMLLFLLPLRFAFRDTRLGAGTGAANELAWQRFDLFILTIFCLDIVVNLRTAVAKDRILYADSKTIAIEYARSWLVLDVLSTLPWDMMLSQNVQVVELLRMLKLARLFKLLNNMQVTEYIFRAIDIRIGTQSYMKVILSYIGIIFLLAHLFACYWFALGTMHDGDGSDPKRAASWVSANGYSSEQVSVQYMAAIFFIFTTFSTVGYGDIAPMNELEQVFCIAAMILGAGIFSYGITCVVGALNTSNPVINELNRRMDLLNVYMKNTKLPASLQKLMRAYIYRLSDEYFTFKEPELVADLSPGLKTQVTILTHFAMIKRVPFFRDASERCVRDIVDVMQMGLYVPDEFVITEGDMGDEMFFIKKGECQIFLARSNHVIATLKEGDYFGETGIILSQCRGASAKSIGYSVLFALTAGDLKMVLKQYEDVRKAMVEAAEERAKSMAAQNKGGAIGAASGSQRKRSCLCAAPVRATAARLGSDGGGGGGGSNFDMEGTQSQVDDVQELAGDLQMCFVKASGTTEMVLEGATQLQRELRDLTKEVTASFVAMERMERKAGQQDRRDGPSRSSASGSSCRRTFASSFKRGSQRVSRDEGRPLSQLEPAIDQPVSAAAASYPDASIPADV